VGIIIKQLTMRFIIALDLLNSPLGTKEFIFSHPIVHIPNLYRFDYVAPRDLISRVGARGDYMCASLLSRSLC
jgi:hypothetical protein